MTICGLHLPNRAFQNTEYVIGHRITDLCKDERPRERLLKYGPSALSNAELVDVLMCITYKKM
jgi:hypothetical protein